jgi:RNA polymerase sigma factor
MKKTAYRTLGRFIDNSDDEWSIVLLAFHEAVQQYEPEKGTFTAFADMVIKRRLIDEIRRQARRRDEISVDMSATDDVILAEAADRQEERKSELKLEIDALTEVLDKYEITFNDLAECSPKASRTRKHCGTAVNLLAGNEELLSAMRTSCRLPVKKIIELGKIPPKILERHRKYIIVAVEITAGDYPLLDEYIKRIRMEGRA